MRRTGGREKAIEDLPPIEARILNLTEWVSAIRDAEIQEFGIPLEVNV